MHQHRPLIILIVFGVVITLIKLWLRPLYFGEAGLGFLLGIAPNLLIAVAFPFGMVFLSRQKLSFMGRQLQVQATDAFAMKRYCAWGLLLLTINELFQVMPVFGRTFDYWDILFSVPGMAIGYWWYCRHQRIGEKMNAV